jgi:hypothetical protein
MDLNVTQTGTASMAVLIGVGRAWIPGTNVANVSGGNFSTQSMYFAENESAVTATVAASDPTNPRIDVVYVAVQDSQYSGSTNQVSTTFIATGTPISGAAYPTNAPAIPNNALAVGWIKVRSGSVSILNSDITNLPLAVVGGYLFQYMNGGVSTTFNNANMTNAAGTASRLIADLGMTSKPYDRLMCVSGQIGVTSASIASGVSNIYIAVSLMQSSNTTAQGFGAMAFLAPGGYIQSAYATTGNILVPAGTTPLARAWITVVTGTISTTVSATNLTNIVCTEMPTTL